MLQTYKKRMGIAVLSAWLGFSPNAVGQAVLFPQLDQPGVAVASMSGNVYTIKNDLLSVSFEKTADNQLVFGGWEKFSFKPSADIFKIQVDDGRVVTSSEMQLVDVNIETLAANPNAAKAALRYPGQAIVAHYTYVKAGANNAPGQNLNITWRAVLRDGSHYLRTEMEIKANENSDMYSVIPMYYEVNNKPGGVMQKAPAVVGNTRGSVIMNDKFFAGLEMPTAYNSVGGLSTADMNGFNPKAWTANSFKWNAANQTPGEILTDNPQLKTDNVMVARGAVLFQEAGELTVAFNYRDGGTALNVVGVDVMNKSGHIVSADYHPGKAGNPAKTNVYHLTIPETEAYVLRYFVENLSDPLRNTNGDIALNLKVRDKAPRYKVVFDGPVGPAPMAGRMRFANFGKEVLAAAAPKNIGTEKISETWVANNWKQLENVPLALREKGYPIRNLKAMVQQVNITETGRMVVDFQYQAGDHKVNFVGVDLVDEAGNVVTADYHYAFTGGGREVIKYNLDVMKGNNYTLRYITEDLTESIDVRSKGKINIQLTKLDALVNPTADSWMPENWTDMANVPEGVHKLGFKDNQVKSFERVISLNNLAGEKELAVTFNYTSGSHIMNLAGLDLVDARGNVIDGDYHIGSSVTNNNRNNVYKIVVPGNGDYRLRYIGHTVDVHGNKEDITSKGNITLAYNDGNLLKQAATMSDKWTKDNWTAMKDVPQEVLDLHANFTAEKIRSYEKPLVVDATASFKITFTYGGVGTTRMNLAGVDVVDADGNVVAADYHMGYAGGNHSKNVYTVHVPKTGVFTVRYIGHLIGDNGGHEPITSSGNIAWTSTPLATVYANAPYQGRWAAADWKAMTAVPQGVLDLNYQASQIRGKECPFYVGAPGNIGVGFKFTGGGARLNMVGVDLLNEKGEVVASDYHDGFTGNQHQNNGYLLEGVEAGLYTLRYMVNNKEDINSTGELNHSLAAENAFDVEADDFEYDKWESSSWLPMKESDVALRIYEVAGKDKAIKYMTSKVVIDKGSKNADDVLEVLFEAESATDELKIAGVELLNEAGEVLVSDYHAGVVGAKHSANVYSLKQVGSGTFTLRYVAYTNQGQQITSKGYITKEFKVTHTFHFPAPDVSPIEGKWSRNIILEKGKSLNISAVIGIVAPKQARRSVAAYVERERAVAWRPYPIYNSWYELNINRNNDPNYDKNMNTNQCQRIVKEWQQKLYADHQVGIKSFVWDDGWDIYGKWTFNKNFPNKFDKENEMATAMNAGIGAWLGPVGGYGESGNYRRAYWNGTDEDGTPRGGMQLSNPKYYKVFYDACHNLLVDYNYDFNYFKFDGISAQFTSVGPDGGDRGNENAEAIINAELEMRKIKADVFFNTSVGTWASPFWFGITDAVWRQENDYGEAGSHNNSRERWITYRDRLVYQNFVQNAPMCPINNLMTHGFILSVHGGSGDRTYDAIVRELRCAFACGSSMVELYNDFELMNTISDAKHPAGSLWGELAQCIRWQEANATALPDAHWVGGNPWNEATKEHQVYGWAGWNGKNAVLTLRNGDTKEKTFEISLREALEIPEYVQGTITLNKGFEDQMALAGLDEGKPIDINKKLKLVLPPSSVYIFDNTKDAAAIDANKQDLKAAIEKAKAIEALLGAGTGQYTCAGLSPVVTMAQEVYDNLYATNKEVTDLVKALKEKLATAQLNAPETGKFYYIKAVANGVEANKTQVYLSSDMTEGKMNLVAEAADAKTLFYLSEGNRLTACGAMCNVAGTGLATEDLGAALQFDAHAELLGRYTLAAGEVTLAAQGATVAAVADAKAESAAWELVSAAEPYELAVNITAAKYATLYAPVALNIPEGVEAFAGETDINKEWLKLTAIESVIPAATPVVLKGQEVKAYPFAFAPSASAFAGVNQLKGSYVDINKPTANNVFTLQLLDGVPGFYIYTGNVLKAGKAYLELSKLQKVKGFRFTDGEVTGIEEMEMTEGKVVFDLSGRCVLQPVKGLYIVDGQKVFIK